MKLLLMPSLGLGAAMFAAAAVQNIQFGFTIFILAQVGYLATRIALGVVRRVQVSQRTTRTRAVYHVR